MGMLGGAAGSACAGKRLRMARGEPKLGLRAVPDVVPAAPIAERSAARERERERERSGCEESTEHKSRECSRERQCSAESRRDSPAELSLPPCLPTPMQVFTM